MSWNKPNDEQLKGGRSEGNRKVRLMPGLFAGVIVVIGAIVAWLMLPQDRPQSVKDKKAGDSSLIKEVTPATVPKAVEEKKEEATKPKVDEKGRPLLTNIIKNVPGRRTPRPVRVIRHDRIGPDGKVIKPPPPLFEAMSDNHLEQLVNYQPGETYLSIVSPADIAEDFKKHVADKIEILPTDTPEAAARKEAYIKVREQILKDIRDGGDLEQMIIEAKRTLDKVAAMRMEYMNMLKEAKDGGASDDDLDDIATAATMLLKEHGANPILSPRQEEKFWEEKANEESKEVE